MSEAPSILPSSSNQLRPMHRRATFMRCLQRRRRTQTWAHCSWISGTTMKPVSAASKQCVSDYLNKQESPQIWQKQKAQTCVSD